MLVSMRSVTRKRQTKQWATLFLHSRSSIFFMLLSLSPGVADSRTKIKILLPIFISLTHTWKKAHVSDRFSWIIMYLGGTTVETAWGQRASRARRHACKQLSLVAIRGCGIYVHRVWMGWLQERTLTYVAVHKESLFW